MNLDDTKNAGNYKYVEGRLEVNYKGIWGSVCNQYDWGHPVRHEDLKVACQ